VTATPFIVGAGLSGLLAAHAWPRFMVLEAADGPSPMHRALLRFRTDSVSKLTGIEFRKVRVRKGIYVDGAGFVPPAIRLANTYSAKVASGRLLPDRSIWDVEPVDRYIAPPSFYEQLVEACGSRICWANHADFVGAYSARTPIISTAPLPVTLRAFGIVSGHEFHRSPITVDRFRVPDADVFQTIYFPDAHLSTYRASITGDLLIVERMSGLYHGEDEMGLVLEAFGVARADRIDSTEQKYGKIAPLPDDAARRALLFSLTHEYGVYSLGRFATWRNVLLDDVVDDIAVIKRMIRADPYAQRLTVAAS